MRNCINLLTFLVFSQISFSQNTVFSYQPATVSKSSPYSSYVISDKKNLKTTLLVRNNQQVEYILLSKDLAQEEKLQIPFSSSMFNVADYYFMTGTANNLGTCFFYFAKDKSLENNKKHVRMEIVDFKNKKVTNKFLFEKPDEETTLDWYAINDSFVLLTVNDKAKQLVFHIMDANGKMSIKTINMDITGMTHQKLTLIEYFYYSHVFYEGDQVDLSGATDITKIYVYPDKLVMLVANENEPPHIWTIDTKNYTLTARKLDMTGFAGFNGKKEKAYNSSLLYKNNIYVLNSSRDNVEIGVFDLASGKLLKKHDISESANFLEAPVETKTYGRKKIKKNLTGDKAIFKELSKGSTGIALALNKENQIILTCGVYDKEQRMTANLAQVSPGPQQYRNYAYERTASFKVMLDPSTFDIISGNQKQSDLDKINEFIDSVDDKSEALSLFKVENRNYISYYDKSAKTFYVKELKL